MHNVWYWKTYGIKLPATAKYVRKPDRIYTIMDFEDGEIVCFHDRTEKSSSNSAGYALYENKEKRVRLVHVSELEEYRANQ